MDLEFNLVFKGEVAQNHDAAATRQKLAKAFKASDEKIAILFSGKPVAVRKGVSSTDGMKLQQQLLNMGAITYLEPVKSAAVESSPRLSASPHVQMTVAPHEPAKKSPSQLPPVAPALVLQPLEEPRSLTEQRGDHDEDSVHEKASFSFPRIGFSFGFLIALLFTLLGIACLLVFSPYPDLMIRKGFAVGAVLTFVGIRKLRK